MSNDVRGLLRDAATRPTAEADVTGAWSRGRRLRARRLAVTSLATAAVVAVGTIAAVNLIPNDHDAKPLAPGATSPAVCAAPSTANDLPAWTKSANPPIASGHVLSSDGNVAAVIWPKTLRAGFMSLLEHNSRFTLPNKILWIVRQPRDGKPLEVTATMPGTNQHAVHFTFPADSSPGEIYPSIVNVPVPGCWHFALSWNGHHSAINLEYGVSERTESSTTTAPATTMTARASTTPQCRTANLNITVGPANGAAGTEYFQIAFRNDSRSACELSGYPGVSFLDASGAQIGLPEDRNPMAHSPVDLAPGATAYAMAGVGNPDVVNCPAAIARRVRIYPPNETAFVIVDAPAGLRVCSAQRVPGFVGPVTDRAN